MAAGARLGLAVMGRSAGGIGGSSSSGWFQGSRSRHIVGLGWRIDRLVQLMLDRLWSLEKGMCRG